MMSIRRPHELIATLLRAAPSLGAALVAVLIPKCPMCVGAYLASFGFGAAAAASAAPLVRPALFMLAGVSLVIAALMAWRRRGSGGAGCCR